VADGESTPEKHRGLTPAWKPGESGNPNGRPKGSRNKLAESFTQALYADFTKATEEGGAEQGAEAIAKFREEDPGGYVRAVASILPKEFVVKDELSDVSDEELAAFVLAARQALLGAESGGSEARKPDRKKQVKDVRPLQ
jgi:hypothetical protein